MDPSRNPYSPGAGNRPTALIGRDAELLKLQTLIGRAAIERIGRGLVLHGLRGVGKTVLLNEFAARCERAGWITANMEARAEGGSQAPLKLRLAQELRISLRKVSLRHNVSDRLRAALGTFESFTLKVGGAGLGAELGIDIAKGRADSGYLAGDLIELAIDLGQAAQERQVGVALCIDELQDADAEFLAALAAAAHATSQRDLPFYIFGAGLPSLPGVLSAAATYAERLFEYPRIGQLNDSQSGQALTEPADGEGVAWDLDAVAAIKDQAKGYPYFLQEFGKAAWDAAAADDRITLSDVLIAVTEAREQLDAGFFRGRWDRATKTERLYLDAMADDGGHPSSTADIAGRRGRRPSDLGAARQSLIAKGLIYQSDHGEVSYTVPGMSDFVIRQRP